MNLQTIVIAYTVYITYLNFIFYSRWKAYLVPNRKWSVLKKRRRHSDSKLCSFVCNDAIEGDKLGPNDPFNDHGASWAKCFKINKIMLQTTFFLKAQSIKKNNFFLNLLLEEKSYN